MNTTTTLKGIFVTLAVFLTLPGFSQSGKITGRIISARNGENITGATASIQGLQKSVVSDVEGRFTMNNVTPGVYTLEFSSLGYQAKAVSEVEVKANEVVTLEITLNEKAKDLSEVTIKATPRRMETVNALLVKQKNLPNISDGISAESIRRSPDRNTGEVLKRVSGATIQENKYVIVRGLADRYNVATLNNAILPSTEADRKVFAFDIIPSNLIDNIQIFKTASPDLPGDFAGGVVQINTQDVPNKNSVSVAAGASFNTAATGKNFRIGYLGDYDYLGFESGARRLPSNLPLIRGLDLDATISQSKRLNNIFGDRYHANALPGQNYQITWAHKSDLKRGGQLGTILAATYRNSQNIYSGERIEYQEQVYGSPLAFDFQDTTYRFTTTLGAMANFAYKKGKTKISLKNLWNRMMDVTNLVREGEDANAQVYKKGSSNETNIRTLFTSQLEGEHVLNAKRSMITWNLNFAYTGGEQPDYRILPYSKGINDINDKSIPFQVIMRESFRFFSNLNDFAYGGNVNYTIPFKWKNGEKNSFKTGAFFLYKTREYSARAFRYKEAKASEFYGDYYLQQKPETIFSQVNINPEGFALDEITNNSDFYSAQSTTAAGYAMMDNRLSQKLRLVWGVRVENFNYTVNTADFSNPNIAINRNYIDVLPSFNLTYNLTSKTNLRFSGFQSVSRPDFREVANMQFYDFSRNAIIKGNGDLERSQNTNIDLRFETYPSAGEIFSVSVFAKYFNKPIESVVAGGSTPSSLTLTYANPNSAFNYGAEFEFRKKLNFLNSSFLENFTVFGNFAYIFSKVDFKGLDVSVFDKDRPMQGQSPYIINGGIQYNADKIGMTFSGLVNRIGNRIAFVGFDGYADVYENGRTVVDLQLAKKLFKDKAEIKFSVSDLLNQRAIYYQNSMDITKRGYKSSEDRVWNTYRYGTNISLTLSANF
ncbi:TonB-dependent receptor [Pollutibacter soli]|uniref:TonB-dependent receptor n=1 Tax=Pollutibacter soli TaxID=3034157 RepID=UPI003013B1B0